MKNRFSLSFKGQAGPGNFLPNLSASLSRAFGNDLSVKVKGEEMVIRIGSKTAWIDKMGFLSGESFTPEFDQ